MAYFVTFYKHLQELATSKRLERHIEVQNGTEFTVKKKTWN